MSHSTDDSNILNWTQQHVKAHKIHIVIISYSIMPQNEDFCINFAHSILPAHCILLFPNTNIKIEQFCNLSLANVIIFYRNLNLQKTKKITDIITKMFEQHFFPERNTPSIHYIETETLLKTADMNEIEVTEIIQCLFRKARSVYIQPLDTVLINKRHALRTKSVILVAHADGRTPVILKIARRDRIEREAVNYYDYIDGRISGLRYARMDRYYCLWNLGGAIYSLIGTEDDTPLAFSDYFRTNDEGKIIQSLEHLFKIILHKPYEERVITNENLFQQYDDVWSSVRGSNNQSKLQDKIFSFHIDENPISIPNSRIKNLINPFNWIKQEVNRESVRFHRMHLAITHGDLHADNILVDKENRCWLLDFERSGYGPRLQDFVELESDIINRILDLPSNNIDLFFKLTLILASPINSINMRSLINVDTQILDHSTIAKTLVVIQKLRNLAYDIFKYEDFREYLWGMLLNSLFLAASHPLNTERYYRALIYASVICRRLSDWKGYRAPSPAEWPPSEWRDMLKELAAQPPMSIIDKERIEQQAHERVNIVALRQFLTTYFNDSELRDLCFDLKIDYDHLPYGKGDKVRELVAYVQRHGRSNEVVLRCKQLRPTTSWEFMEPNDPT